MKRTPMGSVHETFTVDDKIVQKLNPTFPVPSLEQVNVLVDHLRAQGIEAARVIAQDATSRIMERLPADPSSFHYTLEEAKKAAAFMGRLHLALQDTVPLTSFRPVAEFSPIKTDIIWGDLNGGNIIWRDGEPVGIVDYDTVSLGDPWYDIASACVLWPEVFTMKYAQTVITSYNEVWPIVTNGWERKLQLFTLLIYKKLQDAARGKSHLKRPPEYIEGRLTKLEHTYNVLTEAIV